MFSSDLIYQVKGVPMGKVPFEYPDNNVSLRLLEADKVMLAQLHGVKDSDIRILVDRRPLKDLNLIK